MTRTQHRLAWLAVAALPALLALSRATYLGDPLIDFPSELYLSWRLGAGELLYRDIAYHYGPLPPYLLAGIMKIFGPFRSTVLAANFAVYLLVLGTFALLFRRFVGEAATKAALLLASLLAAFNLSAVIYLNYNFLTPYRHGLTYGLLFSLLALISALEAGHQKKRAAAFTFAAGFFACCAAMSKAEFAFALAGSLLPWWALGRGFGSAKGPRALLFPLGALAALAACLVPLVAGGFSAGEALAAALAPLFLPLHPGLRALPIYADSFENLSPARIGLLLASLAFWAAALAGGARLLKPGRKKPPRHLLLAGVAAALLAAGFFAPAWLRGLTEWALLSPWLCLAVAAWLARRRRWPEAALFAFCFLLPLKVLARPTLAEAGFSLALPATLAVFLLAFEGVPKALSWPANRVAPWRALVLLLAVPQAAFAWMESAVRESAMPILVTSEAGNLRMSREMALVFSDLVGTLKERFPKASTLTALPEGTFLNLVLRKPTPFPYLWLHPDQFVVHGEAEILRRLEARPADLIVLLPRGAPVEGFGEFREGFGRQVVETIRAGYDREEGMSELLRQYDVQIYSRKGGGPWR